nr:MAG TPA: hypothetical protein [Caudoviricetes sp.]
MIFASKLSIYAAFSLVAEPAESRASWCALRTWS